MDAQKFFAFIRDYGWIEFRRSVPMLAGRVLLCEVCFIDQEKQPKDPLISISAIDPALGVQVHGSDIIMLIAAAS